MNEYTNTEAQCAEVTNMILRENPSIPFTDIFKDRRFQSIIENVNTDAYVEGYIVAVSQLMVDNGYPLTLEGVDNMLTDIEEAAPFSISDAISDLGVGVLYQRSQQALREHISNLN